MADRGIIPKIMGTRNEFGTPTYGILLSASGVLVLAWLSFSEVIEMLNILYCFAQLIEFAAFIYLRAIHPNMPRPYRVPLEIPGLIMMLTLPTIFILIIISISSFVSVFTAIVLGLFGFIVYDLLEQAKNKGWFHFENQYEHTCPSLVDRYADQQVEENRSHHEYDGNVLENGQRKSINQTQDHLKVNEMTPLLTPKTVIQ